jgi:DNA/RNA endonuclease YhcR with UshA esterase domain
MRTSDRLASPIGLAAEKSGYRWVLPIVIAILCASRVGPTPAVASEEPLTPIAGINKSLQNQEVVVQAVISAINEPQNGAPYYVTLAQGGATVSLIYWPDMQAQLGSKVKVGNVVRVKATVGSYRDRLQLRIRDPSAVEVVSGVAGATTNAAPVATATPRATATPGATATPRATATPVATPAPQVPSTETVIGKISADWVDRAVIISGTVSDFRTAGKSWQLKVQDRTGEIPVVLGEKALVGLAFTELRPGWVVAITGPVKVYEGKPAVVPEVAGAVKVTPQ